MSFKANWAYDFSCNQSLEEVIAVFNDIGPWQWQLRDSYMVGSYLNTRPMEGMHVRVHEYPQSFLKGPREKGFLALLQLEDDSVAEQEDVDRMFRELLNRVMATDINEIEPYDCPVRVEHGLTEISTRSGHTVGLIFWLSRNRFVGSYLFFSVTSRA